MHNHYFVYCVFTFPISFKVVSWTNLVTVSVYKWKVTKTPLSSATISPNFTKHPFPLQRFPPTLVSSSHFFSKYLKFEATLIERPIQNFTGNVPRCHFKIYLLTAIRLSCVYWCYALCYVYREVLLRIFPVRIYTVLVFFIRN